jgi:hypothetical protein
MLFGNHNDKPLLNIRTKLYDGSEVHLHVKDTELLFKTALGVSRIALRNIARMENVASVVTLRKFLWANKFKIHCLDGCKIVGVPKSPAIIHFYDPDTPHARGKIKLWEIEWLEVQTNHHQAEIPSLILSLD